MHDNYLVSNENTRPNSIASISISGAICLTARHAKSASLLKIKEIIVVLTKYELRLTPPNSLRALRPLRLIFPVKPLNFGICLIFLT